MVAYWTFGLLNKLPAWTDVPQADGEFRREWLRRVAVVNLNKAGGGASSDLRRLREIAARDADLLREQLALLDPSVVICGGTGELAARLLFGGAPMRRLESGTRLIDPENGQPAVFAVAHPQARRRGADLYASVVDAAREVGLA
jgi:uracil-DNA glycosylase